MSEFWVGFLVGGWVCAGMVTVVFYIASLVYHLKILKMMGE